MTNEATPIHHSVLAGIFRRNIGGAGYARLFEEFDREERDILLAGIVLAEGEIPVVGSIAPEGYRILLTTHRIVWGSAAELFDLRHFEIISRDFSRANIVHKTVGKGNWQFFEIVDRKGESYTLRIYPQANAFNTFWRILSFIGSRDMRDR